MYLNQFALGVDALDLTASSEFGSLLQSAADLGLAVQPAVRYSARNVVINGLRLHLLEWGEPTAPPLLLLHGGNQTAHSWDLVSLTLAQRFHVLAYDQRGHGDSEWPRDGDASISAMASDARLLIEGLGLAQPVVMGHSMGGMVTMNLVLHNPGIARKAVLIDIGPEIAREGTTMIGEFVRSAQEFDSLEDFIERVAAYDRFRSREHIARTARYNVMKRSDGKYVSKHDHRRRSSASSVTQEVRTPSLADVGSIDCPVLVVRGEQSNVLLADAAERFVAALNSGALVTVPACGHNVHSQNTGGFLSAIAPFLDDVEQTTPAATR